MILQNTFFETRPTSRLDESRFLVFALCDIQYTVLPATDPAGDLQSSVNVNHATVCAEADPAGEERPAPIP